MLQCSFWSTFLYNQKRMWIKSTILHFIAVLTSLLKIKVHTKNVLAALLVAHEEIIGNAL